MEADPDFNKEVIGIDGEDVRKTEKELIQYNSELGLGLAFFHFVNDVFGTIFVVF